ncbi:hypothetical protein IPA_03590 [Ignicoccus pacificus DSM 13166]|uniref:Uncharacterized protein n=1 Tax=Ignicoccus pacificus DSM 13166 TaxID=940294 RepID=A0A977KB07_9CREN|nr:hypothetical protein IPA_03590 [Ignicoccus pacificus DSM 13166]
MLLINVAIFVVLVRLGKSLIPLKSGFLVPASSDFAMASALLALACCPSLLPLVVVISAVLLLLVVKKEEISIIYLKVIAYTISLLSLSFVSYSYYEMVQSFVTGFIAPTPELVEMLAISLVLFALYVLFYDNVKYSIFDPEYCEVRGLKPSLWIGLTFLLAIMTGTTLTFSHGFLLAHVVSLGALLLGYSAQTIKEEIMLTFVFTLASATLSLFLPLSYSVSVMTIALLLLWKAIGKKVPKLRKTSLHSSRPLSSM